MKPNPPPTSAKLQQFLQVEVDKTDAYTRARREQLHAMAVSQWRPAQGPKDDLFRHILAQVQDSFTAQRQKWATKVEYMLARHDAAYLTREDGRDTVFKEIHGMYRAAFQSSQDARVNLLDGLIAAQVQLLGWGRSRREGGCQQLIYILRRRFNDFLQKQRYTFGRTQRIREQKLRTQNGTQDEPRSLRGGIPLPQFDPSLAAPSAPSPTSPIYNPAELSRHPDSCLHLPPSPPESLSHRHQTPELIRGDSLFTQECTLSENSASSVGSATSVPHSPLYTHTLPTTISLPADGSVGETPRTGTPIPPAFSEITILGREDVAPLMEKQYQYAEEEGRRREAYKGIEVWMNSLFDAALALAKTQVAILTAMEDQHTEVYRKETNGLFLFKVMEGTVEQARTALGEEFLSQVRRHFGSVGSSPPLSPVPPPTPCLVLPPPKNLKGLASTPSWLSLQNSPSQKLQDTRSSLQARLRPSLSFEHQLGWSAGRIGGHASAGDPMPFTFQTLFTYPPPDALSTMSPTELRHPSIQNNNLQHSRHRDHDDNHTRIFNGSSAKRTAAFNTQMHKFHSEVAAIQLESQIIFDESLARFEHEIHLKQLERESAFHERQRQRGRDFWRREVGRGAICQLQQSAIRTSFEELQRRHDAEFKETCPTPAEQMIKGEAERVKAFAVWRGQVENTLEVKIGTWGRRFARDGSDRESQLSVVQT